jgi:AraC-like DNA-binding protein
VTGNVSHAPSERVAERRRAVALARHFREAEGLSIAQIGERLGRSPATVKAYFYDPTGEKARAVKGALLGGLPGLRGVHAAAQRQGRCLCVLQGVPSRRHRGALDSRRCTCGDVGLARQVRPPADVV